MRGHVDPSLPIPHPYCKLASFLLPLSVLVSSHELSGPSQSSRRPAALSGSASPPAPAPPLPGCTPSYTPFPPHCPASPPVSTSQPGSPAEVDLSFQPSSLETTNTQTKERSSQRPGGRWGGHVPPEQRSCGPTSMPWRLEMLTDGSGEPPPTPARHPEDAPASGACRGDSLVLWFLPLGWLPSCAGWCWKRPASA